MKQVRIEPQSRAAKPKVRRRWRILASTLTWRILAVNIVAPVILVVGLLQLDRYRDALLEGELASLRTQAEVFAAALGEGAVADNGATFPELLRDQAALMMRRLAEPAGVRARLFATDGNLVADSRRLLGAGGVVQIEELPPPAARGMPETLRGVLEVAGEWLGGGPAPVYIERATQTAADYEEAIRALTGDSATAMRLRPGKGLVLSAAVPVQRLKQVVGVVMLSSSGEAVEGRLIEVRLAILRMFGLTLLVTVLLSLYLAGAIASPLTRLAAAAEQVRRGHGRANPIPDLSRRRDEIGELSAGLREMTDALWRRMDAIEAFAADVAHEIKNPLTSLRSAVETVARVRDPEQQLRLMTIIQDDVQRLDRLISDISDASRLDAELSRAETGPVPIRRMLAALAEVYRSTAPENVRLVVDLPEAGELEVPGMEDRLVQVFRNLIGNAISFSPAGGTIRIAAARERDHVVVTIEDDGPGIPNNKLEAIFERFYSERPQGEKFGTHSGLGLSISKQIVEAHGGVLFAENRVGPDGIAGARFTVRLPVA